jgi:hypothetical protein
MQIHRFVILEFISIHLPAIPSPNSAREKYPQEDAGFFRHWCDKWLEMAMSNLRKGCAK